MNTGRVILILCLLLFILFLPSRVIQFISLLYLAVLGFSFFYSHLVSRYVVVRRKDLVLRAQRLESIEIILLVENRSPFPVHYLSVIDTPNHFFLSEPGKFIISLGPGEKKRLSYQIKSRDRGEYSIGPAIIQGSDPLGFFPWQKRQQEVQRLIIYPETLPLTLKHRSGLPAGNIRIENRIYEDITRYRSLREYIPGDDLKWINWKVSARMGKLYSMDYLAALYSPVLILLNLTVEDYPLRYRYHRVERAVTVVASLVSYFLALRQEIGFIASGSFKNEGSIPVADIRGTHGHAMIILEMLARIVPSREATDVTRLLKISGIEVPLQTRIEVVTPMLRDEQRKFLKVLKEKGCQVELFLVGPDAWPEKELVSRKSLSKEFTVFCIKDYGNELIYQ